MSCNGNGDTTISGSRYTGLGLFVFGSIIISHVALDEVGMNIVLCNSEVHQIET